MTAETPGSHSAGLLGPVALSGVIALLLVTPVMRGGNRHVALIAIELIALATALAIWMRALQQRETRSALKANPLVLLLALSPLWLAVIYLTPLPGFIWSSLAGRELLDEALKRAGIMSGAWHALSVSPDATAASLLAGVPIAVAFVVGYLASLAQLRLLTGFVLAMAFGQVLLGLLQLAGGETSPLFFGILTFGPPVGTFANRNHFANYLAMALVILVWHAYESHREPFPKIGVGKFGTRHRTALWSAGALLLVAGILMTRSRGGVMFGLPFAVAALVVAALRIQGWSRGWQLALPIAFALLVGATALVGFDEVTSRISFEQLSGSAGFRGVLTRTSFDAAIAFFPWGSGWGTYDLAYPRFQPAELPGRANQAHMDYVQFLMEGGAFALVLAGALAWLVIARGRKLIRRVSHDGVLDREAMAAAICGLGFAALLMHSLVEFNMRIPANAMLGALLAGIFLRPLRAPVESP